jgi:hypothetical protein
MRSVLFRLTLIVAVFFAVAPVAVSDELAAQGRAVFEKSKETVITVQSVISFSMGQQEEQEQEVWANGTVVDPSGLTVLSLVLVDPASALSEMDDLPGEISSKVVSLKMILSDGNEVPAEVVLRDKDLDLAFVRPTQKLDKPMVCVNVAELGKPQLLDTVVAVTQLGEVARRAHSVLLERIETIVEKPRRYYVVGQHRSNEVLSSPVFTLDGKFVGIGALRSIKGGQSARRRGGDKIVTIVTGEDIKEVMTNVPPIGTKIKETTTTVKPKEKPESATPEASKDTPAANEGNQVTLPANK